MEKKLCCPNCRSLELKFPEKNSSEDYVVCLNCEYEFYDEDTLTEKIERNEKRFNVFVTLFIVTLVAGMFFLMGFSSINYGFDVKYILIPLRAVGFTKTAMIIFGFGCFLVSFVSLYFVFVLRKYISILREKRRYLRNHCYEE